jgi:hypothetical protein
MATAPTGDILKFIEEFNKDFDAFLVKKQADIVSAKAVLEELKKISDPKETEFPKGETNVKTVGDLFAYCYNLEKGGIREPINSDEKITFNKDTEKGDLKKKKLEVQLAAKSAGRFYYVKSVNAFSDKSTDRFPTNNSLRFLEAMKEKKGPNPDLWSPGQYVFDIIMRLMSSAIKKPKNYEDVWSSGYLEEMANGNKFGNRTFDYTIAGYTADGNIPMETDILKIASGTESYDGIAGYNAFQRILEVVDKNLEYFGISQMLDIQSLSSGKNANNPADYFKSIRTRYLTGNIDELKQASGKSKILLETERGYSEGVMFYGDFEFISLYKAFKQAGDGYVPVTLPLDATKYPGDSIFMELVPDENAEEKPAVDPVVPAVVPEVVPAVVTEEKPVEEEKKTSDFKGYTGKIRPTVEGFPTTILAKAEIPEFSVYVGDPKDWKEKGIVKTEDVKEEDFENLEGAYEPSYLEEGEEDEYVEQDFPAVGESLLALEPPEVRAYEAEVAKITDNSPEKVVAVSKVGGTYTSNAASDGTLSSLLASSVITNATRAGRYSNQMVPPEFNGVPMYSQSGDPRWNNEWYDMFHTTGRHSCKDKWGNAVNGVKYATVGTSGCGPTSLSMVVNYWASKGKTGGKFTSPQEMCWLFERMGNRICGKGSTIFSNKLKDELKKLFNLNLKIISVDKIIPSLEANEPIVMSGSNYYGKNILGNNCDAHYDGGHFVCLTGIDSLGRIRVNDPGRDPNGASEARSSKGGITHFPDKNLAKHLTVNQIGKCTPF